MLGKRSRSLFSHLLTSLVQRVEQELENHEEYHRRKKAHDCFNQNIHNINKSEGFYGVIEKYVGSHQDGRILHKPTEAHPGDRWAIGHVVAATGFQHLQYPRAV